MQQLLFDESPRPAPAGGIPALTLTQPWASLMGIGAKTIETRSWGARYRGPVAIHAAKAFPYDVQRLCFTEPFATVLSAAGLVSPNQLPLGAVVAIGRLVDCRQVTMFTELPGRNTDEWCFGDFDLGRWLWYFEDVQQLPEPIPARGALGLWEWVS